VIAELPNVRLGYDDVGDGDVVLLVHGFPHGRRLWAPAVDALGALGGGAPRWRCVAPDLRGFGDSDSRGPYTMDGHADDLAALCDALGLARPVVVGLSMGGYVALALWRRHASRVRALVLADTRATPDDDQVRARRLEHAALVRREGLGALADVQLGGALGRTTRERRPDVVASFRALMARCGTVEGMVGALDAMRARPDSTPLLATIDVPVLVVGGEEDAITRPSEMRALHERIAGSRLVMIPEAGHATCWEQPAAFSRALDTFLASLD
jgi:pimeloyl-ACP methyl ester carboxylesterase